MEQAAPPTQTARLLDIAPDRMSVRFVGVADSAKVSAAELLAAFERARIRVTDAVRARVAEHTNAAGEFHAGAGIVLATGTPAVDDVPAQLRLYHQEAQAEGLEPLDPHARSGLAIVAKDQAVAEAIAYAKGADGAERLRAPLQRKRSTSGKVALGRNVALLPDGKTIVAQVSGCLHAEGLRVWVEPRLAIPGNVDFSTGNIHFDGDIAVGGTVLDLFSVWTSGDLSVHGAIEAAHVDAGRDLTVDGGIMGKGKGACRAGRNLRAKYITNAEISVAGDIIVRREIVNSRIVSGGAITVESGIVVGCRIAARGSLTCGAIGSAAEVRTVVEVGIDAALAEAAPKSMAAIVAKQHRAQRIRQEAAAISGNPAEAQSQAADKLGEASRLESESDADLNALRGRLAAADALVAEVFVKETVFPGTTIRCGALQVRIAVAMPGPLHIGVRDGHAGAALVAVNPQTGSVTRLPRQGRAMDELESLRHFLAKAATAKATA